MAKESPADIVRRVEECWDAGKLDELDEYFDPSFASSAAIPGMPPTLATAKMAHGMSTQAMPDRKTEILDLFGSGDKVCVRMRMTATNKNGLPWFGVEANNNPVDVQWISVYEVRNGKITGHWATIDGFTMLAQLGAWAPPPMPSA